MDSLGIQWTTLGIHEMPGREVDTRIISGFHANCNVKHIQAALNFSVNLGVWTPVHDYKSIDCKSIANLI